LATVAFRASRRGWKGDDRGLGDRLVEVGFGGENLELLDGV
jgi:hypothetical protein